MYMRLVHPEVTKIKDSPKSDETAPVDQAVRARLVGISRWAAETRAKVSAHAAHDNPVMIEGEPGSGKEFVARLIHESSARRHGPFISITCEPLSEESIEGALFGWIRVLPTGQNRVQRGLVEGARGGTLYVSGVTSLTASTRVKLARLIEHQEFRHLGDSLLENADVRVLFGRCLASDSDSEGSSRVVETFLAADDRVSVPPLRRRRTDIDPLAAHFLRESCLRLNREFRQMTPDAMATLRRYDWPGNVSEMKHVIDTMVRQAPPPSIDASHLPADLHRSAEPSEQPLPQSGVNLAEEVERFERSLINAALRTSGGVQSRAAERLGLKLTTLNSKIARYGIDVRSFKR